MPASWKCTQCGLVNFAEAANCKRCNAEAAAPPVPGMPLPPPAPGIVLADGYVMPPPPFALGGIWRDNKTLVMTRDAELPDQCVKCGAAANGYKLKQKLQWHHPALYLFILAAWLLYFVLAATLSKRATVFLGLCPKHVQSRGNQIAIAWGMLALGVLMGWLGFSYDYFSIGIFGMLLAVVAILRLVFASRVLTVKKIDDRFVFLNGVNANYLAQFPYWQGQY